MGILVCQGCGSTIEHFEHEKVMVLYGKCPSCNQSNKEKK